MAEYACHEGNYAMFNILSGARADEKAAAEAAARGDAADQQAPGGGRGGRGGGGARRLVVDAARVRPAPAVVPHRNDASDAWRTEHEARFCDNDES